MLNKISVELKNTNPNLNNVHSYLSDETLGILREKTIDDN